MCHILSYFQNQGLPAAMLWVDYDNLPARTLYEKLGFTFNPDEAEAVFVCPSTTASLRETA